MINNLDYLLQHLKDNTEEIEYYRKKYNDKLTDEYIYLTFNDIDNVFENCHIRYINRYGELRSGLLNEIIKGKKIEDIKLVLKNSYRTWKISLQSCYVFYRKNSSSEFRKLLESII